MLKTRLKAKITKSVEKWLNSVENQVEDLFSVLLFLLLYLHQLEALASHICDFGQVYREVLKNLQKAVDFSAAFQIVY